MNRLGLAVIVPTCVAVGGALAIYAVVRFVCEPIDRAVRLVKS